MLKGVTLASLLDRVIKELGLGYKVSCSYSWTYSKFVINNATGYDVLKRCRMRAGRIYT